MDKHIKLISSLGLSASLGVAALVGFATAPQKPVEAAQEVRASLVPTTSQTLAPPVTAPVEIADAVTISKKSFEVRGKSDTPRLISEATTTTSEVPPPLTPEQEANIPGPEELSEHLPQDWDLPSEVEIATPES